MDGWKRLFHTFLWRMCLSLSPSLFTQCWFGVGRRPADVGVKFLTLLNEFPRKGGRRQSAEGERERGQKRGEIQARFQFPISASSPSALSQMYRGKKAGKGRPGERGGNEDDSQDRQNFEKGRKERRRVLLSSFLRSQLPL